MIRRLVTRWRCSRTGHALVAELTSYATGSQVTLRRCLCGRREETDLAYGKFPTPRVTAVRPITR